VFSRSSPACSWYEATTASAGPQSPLDFVFVAVFGRGLWGNGVRIDLDEAGFELHWRYRRFRYPWQDVGAFEVTSFRLPLFRFVQFSTARHLGGSALLPDLFEVGAADLARLLEQRRMTAVRTGICDGHASCEASVEGR
jgi:hypothetical protein